MKIGLSGGLFVWLWMLAMPFSVQAQDLGPGFTKVKDGIYVYAAKERQLDVQRRVDRGGTGDDRHLPKAARHAPVDGRREEAYGQASRFVIDTESAQ